MEEEHYKKAERKENSEFTSRFEIMNNISNLFYSNLQLRITNITQKIISDLIVLSFKVLDKGGNELKNSIKAEFQKGTLKPTESTLIDTNLDELKYMVGQKECSYKDITLYFEFSCKDEKGDDHKYSASLYISDTQYSQRNEWKVKELK